MARRGSTIAGVVMCLCAPALGMDAWLGPEVDRWLADRLREARAEATVAGVVVGYTLTVRSLRSSDEVERRWAEVERFPDHPERTGVEYHRRLVRSPETSSGTMWYAGASLWRLEEHRDAGNVFAAGGRGEDRWMLATGPGGNQLTIIRSGVPFPAPYNIGRFFDLLRERLALCGLLGLPHAGAGMNAERVSADSGSWTALLRSPGSGRAVLLRGDLGGLPPVPRLVEVLVFEDGHAPGAPVTTVRLSGHVLLEPGPQWCPASVVVDRADDIRETYSFHPASLADRTAVRSTADVPDRPAGCSVLDFRSPGAADWARYADMPRVTWRVDQGGDSYAIEAAPPGVAARPPGAATPSEGWSFTRVAALIVFIVVVAGVPIVAYGLRRVVR